MDTIFALASGRGRSGVAVVRISGQEAVQAAQTLCGSVPDRGVRRLIARDGDLIDEALVLHFPEGHSFTGEAVIELQCHGSPAVVGRLLMELGDLPNLRLADAGEFTRRALENGRLNLSEVEGLADLIDAETEAQRRQAVRVFDGALGTLADELRANLIRAAALIEATIDFADEEVPTDVTPEVRHLLENVLQRLEREQAGFATAERIRDGFEVAIVGPPNVGKSTLLNRLAKREAAITSEIAGTTRDVIEVRMDIAGLPVTLLDTAGVRSTSDRIEQLGVDLAKRRAERADLRIFLVEDGEPVFPPEPGDLVVSAKSDIAPRPGLSVSGRTGAGVEELVGLISDALSDRSTGAGVAIRERHRVAINEAHQSVTRTLRGLETLDGEMLADELRNAVRQLNSIVGRVDVEDLLDEIFASFCIGK